MPASPAPKRTLLIGLLWGVVGFTAWLMTLQLAMIVFASKGEWQSPDFYQVVVVEVQKDGTNALTRDVDVTIDGELDTITLPKSEALALHARDTFWALDNFYATALRPAQFHLTPFRVLAEYPEVLLLAALLFLRRLRRAKWGMIQDPMDLPGAKRQVFRDTFHVRAQRHARPEDPPRENPSTSDPDAV